VGSRRATRLREDGGMPLKVHLRPNAPYLALLAIGVVLLGFGAVGTGAVRYLAFGSGAALVVLLGYPVVLSTVCRVPLVVVEPDGIRLPLMGVRLRWTEVAATRLGVSLGARGRPVLLIVPVDPEATIRSMRPWLRRQGRDEFAKYGSPVVLQQASLNRPLNDVQAAIEAARAGRQTIG
jgi:hypothetical protein